MAFDATEYLTTDLPVYDKDNPPERMSQAIRMAVQDVEAMLAAGHRYRWSSPSIAHFRSWHAFTGVRSCAACTAGAVIYRLNEAQDNWEAFGPTWAHIFSALSSLTASGYRRNVAAAFQIWPTGFARRPKPIVHITPANEDFPAFKRDMLALADKLEAEGS